MMAFFLIQKEKICLKDTVENHLKTQVLKKNQNWALKKKENLNEKSEKIRIKQKKLNLFKHNTSFFKFSKVIKYV